MYYKYKLNAVKMKKKPNKRDAVTQHRYTFLLKYGNIFLQESHIVLQESKKENT